MSSLCEEPLSTTIVSIGKYVISPLNHYDDVTMSGIASRTTSLTTVYLIVYSRADQRKHQSSASLAFVRGIHRRPVNSPHKGSVMRKMVPFDDVIMSDMVPSIISVDLQCSIRFYCPACRTYVIASRFWVVVICPIIKCLTVLEFSFILFDLCLFITIFNLILNYVLIVTFWILTYHKIWILLIIYCLYEIIELFIFLNVWKCFGVLWVNWCQFAVEEDGLG